MLFTYIVFRKLPWKLKPCLHDNTSGENAKRQLRFGNPSTFAIPKIEQY